MVYDCKLARETKAATLLQLSHYAALLAEAQGKTPENIHVVPPSEGFAVETYRVLDYAAYYRSGDSSPSYDLRGTLRGLRHAVATRRSPLADCRNRPPSTQAAH